LISLALNIERIIAYHAVREAGQTACERAAVMLELIG
jgi:hypothetical protein